jgi:hypothetical protein
MITVRWDGFERLSRLAQVGATAPIFWRLQGPLPGRECNHGQPGFWLLNLG